MQRFGDDETRLIAEGRNTKATRRRLPVNLHDKAVRMLDYLLRARSPQDCALFSGFKMLAGTSRGKYQFKVGGAYRIRFQWEGRRAVNIRIGEFHDEDKR